ncbi:zinc-ribbon domain-containing protein [Anaeromyxobacter sp. Red801]|uniref:zinc-ribbon domain-containing protein n=1 Tax=Anaeromyxobacter sp. Red801 TaxID=3411632 RepID=UPI003B9EB3E5
MKFSCDRCGKRYATADTPVPGRVYKLKCRACGHVIVLKGPAAGAPPGAPPRSAAVPPAPPPPSAPTPVPTVTAVEIPPPPPPEPEPLPPVEPPPPLESLFPEAHEASAAPRTSVAPPGPAPRAEPEPADAGYVDLFEEGSLGDGTGLPLARGPRSGPPPSGDDASGELPAPAPEPAVPAAPPLPTPRVPDLPRPPSEQRGAPLKLIGFGVLVMLAIVAVAVWRGAGRTAPSRPPAPASAPAAKAPEAAPAPVPPAPGPAQAPAAAEPAPGAAPAPGTATPQAEPPPAPERAQPARPAPEAPRPSRAPAAAPAAPAPAGETSGGLTPERIQQVIATSRPRFDACLAEARPGRGLALDGRTVNLRVAITPAGAATYPTFDDVTIGSTELGACLKSAARQMAFPRFEGEPVRIEVPITLPKR